MRLRRSMVLAAAAFLLAAAAVADDDVVAASVSSIGADRAAVWSRLTVAPADRERISRLAPQSDDAERLLRVVYYEAYRAGVDPALVLAIIEVESAFDRFAVSRVGAIGYMQIMPFWRDLTANDDSLFDLETNVRYGCSILASYIAMERGDLFLALGRYNGSRGRPEYPSRVLAAWEHWSGDGRIENETL